MSGLLELEKGDTILTKDGRTMQVIAIYKPDGIARCCDCIAVGDESPMRTPIWSDNIQKILTKNTKTPHEMKTDDGKLLPKDPILDAVKGDVAKRQAEKKKEIAS